MSSYYTVIELGCTDPSFIGIAGIGRVFSFLWHYLSKKKKMEMDNILMVNFPFFFPPSRFHKRPSDSSLELHN